jgi:hypothetical protein
MSALPPATAAISRDPPPTLTQSMASPSLVKKPPLSATKNG